MLADNNQKELKKWGIKISLTVLIFFLFFGPSLIHAEIDSSSKVAQQQFEQKNFDSAIQIFDSIIFQFPANKEAFYNRGLSYYQLHQYPNAISDFETCLKIDSDFKDAAIMKATSLQNSGQFEKAQQELNKIHARYGDYEGWSKQIKFNQLCILISREWYYILGIFLLVAILLALIFNGMRIRKTQP